MPHIEATDSDGKPIKLTAEQERELLKEATGLDDAELDAIEDIEDGGGDVIAEPTNNH